LVFYQYWNNQRLIPVTLRSIDDVVQLVEELARNFNKEQIFTSASQASEITYKLEPA